MMFLLISKFIVVTSFICSVAIACTLQAARATSSEVGCLTAKPSPYSDTTYILDTTNKQLMLKSLLLTEGLGFDNVSLDFSNPVSRGYEANNATGEVMELVGVDGRTGQRYIPSMQDQTPQHFDASPDGKYLSVITTGSPGKLIVYHLPDLQLVLTRDWFSPTDFQDLSWSRAGHKLAFLEQGTTGQALVTVFDPDNMHTSSAVISADMQAV